jgi:hypothetical protein
VGGSSYPRHRQLEHDGGTVKLTDPDFTWTPAVKTSVQETWKRFGWKATTDKEREDRQRKASNEDKNERAA